MAQKISFFALVLSLVVAGPVWEDTYYIAMRDGVKLRTIVYTPIHVEWQKLATVFIQTPYNASGLTGEGKYWVEQGLNCAMQDMRGRFASGGNYSMWRTEADDSADSVAWMEQQPWSNGVFFATGTSANGIGVYLAPQSRPGFFRAAEVVVATAEVHSMSFQHGVLRQSLLEGWLTLINEASYIPTVLAHEARTSWWDPASLNPDKWDVVTFPTVNVAGWYDIFSQWQIDAVAHFRNTSEGAAFMFMLPTGHCPHGAIAWPNSTLGATVAIALTTEIFKAMKDPAVSAKDTTAYLLSAGIPTVAFYVMGPGLPGSTGNYWTEMNEWPVPQVASWFLAPGSALTATPNATLSSTTFLYDPTNPAQSPGGNNLILQPCGPQVQATLESRSDVISFTTPPFSSEAAIVGQMFAELYVSSSRNDTDFHVTLTDVWPDGTSMLIQYGAVRMRWRNEAVTPELITPGQIYMVSVDLWSTAMVINAGHRVRVDITSSNYPHFSVNPNNGLPLSQSGALLTAKNTVYFGQGYPSRLLLPMVPLSALPPTGLELSRSALERLNPDLEWADVEPVTLLWKERLSQIPLDL